MSACTCPYLWLLTQYRPEIPHRDGKRAGRLECDGGGGTGQVVEQRHLAEHRAPLKRAQVADAAIGRLLADLHLPAGDDKQPDSRLALTQERRSGGVITLHTVDRERLKLVLCQVVKQGHLGQYVFIHLRWLPFSEQTITYRLYCTVQQV